MNYNQRIGDDFLRADHVDGEVLQHTELNELESVVKTAVNANYEDIQKLQNGVLVAKNSEELSGATLSPLEDETLQNSDVKVPTSAQVKSYIDTQDNTKQDLLVSGTSIKTVNGQSLLGSGNLVIGGLQELTSPVVLNGLSNGFYRLPTGCEVYMIDGDNIPYLTIGRSGLLSVTRTILDNGLDGTTFWCINEDTIMEASGDYGIDYGGPSIRLYAGAFSEEGGDEWYSDPKVLF